MLKNWSNQGAALGWEPISVCNSLAEKGNSSVAMSLILSHIQLGKDEGLTWILLKEKFLYKNRNNKMQEEKANSYTFARLDITFHFGSVSELRILCLIWHPSGRNSALSEIPFFQMLRLCYICWGHNFIFLSGTALPVYQMDDAMVKWMCGFVLLHLRESQSKADIFSRLPFVYHFSSQWEESYCWTKHFWLPNRVTDLLSVITHRVTDFGIG